MEYKNEVRFNGVASSVSRTDLIGGTEVRFDLHTEYRQGEDIAGWPMVQQLTFPCVCKSMAVPGITELENGDKVSISGHLKLASLQNYGRDCSFVPEIDVTSLVFIIEEE